MIRSDKIEHCQDLTVIVEDIIIDENIENENIENENKEETNYIAIGQQDDIAFNNNAQKCKKICDCCCFSTNKKEYNDCIDDLFWIWYWYNFCSNNQSHSNNVICICKMNNCLESLQWFIECIRNIDCHDCDD